MSWRHHLLFGLFILAVAGVTGTVLLPGNPAAGVWAVAAVTALAAVVLLEDFRRRREGPLRAAAEVLYHMADGRFDDKLYAGGGAALTALARAVNTAREALAERLARLEDDRRRLRAVLG